ncbi:MAG: peptidoglycan DD-metalloendopeptidase family protein [Candidatus Zambryskibacteria bacterium]|nr:peptidoglycan DD-metalloendopeptidase family protein [Candidatus Zambryskibacteria bacterium]
MSRYKKILILILVGILSLQLINGNLVLAQSVDEIKKNIDSHNEKIKQLEEEIKVYEKEIETVGEEAQTLQNAVKVLDTSQKKIKTEIQKTETNIEKTNLTITDLSSQIQEIEEKIKANEEAISKTLNDIRQNDDRSLIESFLTNKSLSEVLNEYETANKFQQKVRDQSLELMVYKDELSGKKNSKETEKNKMIFLKSELDDQNQILVINKKEKNSLLTATKNKETEYKKVLANIQAEKERFEQELYEFESQLKRTIDPNSYPSSGKGILSWPLDNIFITQFFGKTEYSARLYKSGTHNGVDFRASIGTPIKTTLNGIVKGFGNTDEQKGCYSYGKWILIEHPNGLSTLYAHLSLIKVSKGQQVSTGEIIGYSGNTGYSTGPHLHLTVYATQGVEIQRYSSSINCKNVTIPVADIRAYLDPMLYLPKYD